MHCWNVFELGMPRQAPKPLATKICYGSQHQYTKLSQKNIFKLSSHSGEILCYTIKQFDLSKAFRGKNPVNILKTKPCTYFFFFFLFLSFFYINFLFAYNIFKLTRSHFHTQLAFQIMLSKFFIVQGICFDVVVKQSLYPLFFTKFLFFHQMIAHQKL